MMKGFIDYLIGNTPDAKVNYYNTKSDVLSTLYLLIDIKFNEQLLDYKFKSFLIDFMYSIIPSSIF